MRTHRQAGALIGSALLVLLAPLLSRPLRADEATEKAIDKGVVYLLGEVQKTPFGSHTFGSMALETYALVVAGVPLDHPLVRTNFNKLNRALKKSRNTYTLSCYIFALDAAIAQTENDYLLSNPRKSKDILTGKKILGRAYLPYLHTSAKALIEMQNASGAWRYGPGPDFDNSNVQFAVLGLGIAARRGVPVPRSVWEGVHRHFVEGQQKNGASIGERLTLHPPDERGRRDDVEIVRGRKSKKPDRKDKARRGGTGRTIVKPRKVEPEDDPIVGAEDIDVQQRGWDYQNKGQATWNMTCAGVSSLLVVRENLKRGAADDEWKDLLKAIRDGYGWLMGNWKLTETFYGLYSLEKVADIGGVKKFGAHDWYDHAKRHLVGSQQADGKWKGTGAHGETDRVATAFALLILRRATMLLTKDPGSSIVISGRRATIKTAKDREWVYLPDLDTSLHYPTILGVLRKRPSVKLARFLTDVIRVYPIEYRGELASPLVHALETATSSKLKSVFQEHLESITGLKTGDADLFRQWGKDWNLVHEVVARRDKEQAAELLRIYADEIGSVPLKQTAAWGLVQLSVTKAVPRFFRDLDHDSEEIRRTAYTSFRTYFTESVPTFDPRTRGKERAAQIQSIRDWYNQWREKRKKK